MEQKKIKKKKNSLPTDPNIFKPVSGDATFLLFGLTLYNMEIKKNSMDENYQFSINEGKFSEII